MTAASGDDKTQAAICALANGGFVIAWTDSAPTAPYASTIRVRVYDHAAVAAGADFAAASLDAGQQQAPALAGLIGGDFVLAWRDLSGYIKAQVFGAAGGAKGGVIAVDATAPGTQWAPSVAALSGGGFVMAWLEDQDRANASQHHIVRGQVFTAAGDHSGADFVIADEITDMGSIVSLAGLANGNFAAAWDGVGVQAGVFTATGQAVGSVAVLQTGLAAKPSVAALASGFVVVWNDVPGGIAGDSGYSIVAQSFTAAGVSAATPFLVNTSTTHLHANPAAATLANGQVVATWNDDRNDDALTGLLGQVFTAGGQKFATEFAANSSLAGTQLSPVVAGLTNGSFVVAWNDQPEGGRFSVKARLFLAQ